MGKKNKDPVEREPPNPNNYRSQENIQTGHKPSIHIRKSDRIDRRSSILMRSQVRKVAEKTKCDLSIETDNCILRRFYKRRLMPPVNKAIPGVRVNNTGTGSEFVIKRPDGSACGDVSKTDELGPPVVTSESLAINNLKTLLSKLLEKHLNENNELKRGTRKTLTDLLKSLQTPVYPVHHPLSKDDEDNCSEDTVSNNSKLVPKVSFPYRHRRYKFPKSYRFSKKIAKRRTTIAMPKGRVAFLNTTNYEGNVLSNVMLESLKSVSKTSTPKNSVVIKETTNLNIVESIPADSVSMMFNQKNYDEQSSVDEGIMKRKRIGRNSSQMSHSSDTISWSKEQNSGDTVNKSLADFQGIRQDDRKYNIYTIFDFKSPRWLVTKENNDLTKKTSRDLQEYYIHQLTKNRTTRPKRCSSTTRNEVNMISIYESVQKWPLQKKNKDLYDPFSTPLDTKVSDFKKHCSRQEEILNMNRDVEKTNVESKVKCNTATEHKISHDSDLSALIKIKGFKVNRSKRKPISNFKRSNPFRKDVNVNILNALKNYPASLELRREINKILRNESYTIIAKSSNASLTVTIPSKTTVTQCLSYNSSKVAIKKCTPPVDLNEEKANILDLIDPLSTYKLGSNHYSPDLTYSLNESSQARRNTSTQYTVINASKAEINLSTKSDVGKKKCVEVTSQCTNTYDLQISKEIDELQVILRGLLTAADKLLDRKCYKRGLIPYNEQKFPELKGSEQSVPQIEIISKKPSVESVLADADVDISHTETHIQKEIKKRFERNKAKANKLLKAEKATLSKRKKKSSYNIIDSETIVKTIDMTQYQCVLPKHKKSTTVTCSIPKSQSVIELSTSKTNDNKTLYLFWKNVCKENLNSKISDAVSKAKYKSKVRKQFKPKQKTKTIEAANVHLELKEIPHTITLLKSNSSLEKRITEVKLDVSHIENESNFIDYLDYDSELATYSKKSQENNSIFYLEKDEVLANEDATSQHLKRGKPVKKITSKNKYMKNALNSKDTLNEPTSVYRPVTTQVYKYLSSQTAQANKVPRMNTILQIRNLSDDLSQCSQEFDNKVNEPMGDGPQVNLIHTEAREDDLVIEDDETYRQYRQTTGFLPKDNDLFLYEKKYCLRCLLYLFVTLVFFAGITWALYYFQKYNSKYKKKTVPRNNRTIPAHRW